MNTLTKLVVINLLGAAVLGSLTMVTQASPPPASALPEISALTDAAGARIADELNRQLARAASVAMPVRPARAPSVIVTEGSGIVSEEVVVVASRLPKLDTLADATDISAAVRF
jgi:hypothetical protein